MKLSDLLKTSLREAEEAETVPEAEADAAEEVPADDEEFRQEIKTTFQQIEEHAANSPTIPTRMFRDAGAGEEAKKIDDLYWQLDDLVEALRAKLSGDEEAE